MAIALMEEIFNRLVDYTVYHFSTEEQLIKEHNFPGAEKHKNENEELVNKINYLKYQAQDGNLIICTLTDVDSEIRQKVLERLFFCDILNTVTGIKGYMEIKQGG